MKSGLARFVLRFAWHLTSLLFVNLAALLAWWSRRPVTHGGGLPIVIGIVFTVAGLFDAVGSRGRHLGWPLLTAVGLMALVAGLTTTSV